MPGINEASKPPSAECPGQDIQQGENGAVAQPRQPSSLQGLLRFALDATKDEDAPEELHGLPLDEERRRFLEEALKSMTINVIEVLQKQIGILKNAGNLKLEDDITDYTNAFKIILDYVDNVDIANDFHKMGGFNIFEPCIKCVHITIRASACDVLAELCQNNPYCQKAVLDNCFLPLLFKVLDEDVDNQVCVKALYAVSCITRENQDGFNQLIQYNGLTVLLKTLQKNDEKLCTKTTFLLSALCRSQSDLKSRLIFLEYVPCLISLISEERKPSHEHVLCLLVSLVEENQTAQLECKNPQYNLKELLQRYLSDIRNKDECLEEEQYCRRLIRLLQYA